MSSDAPPFDLAERMRFDPHEGIAELDRHLRRLGEAAAALGFRFDRHGARNELQAATFGRKAAASARLLLSPTGAMAIEVRPIVKPETLPVTAKLSGRRLPGAALKYKTSDRAFFDAERGAAGTYEVLFADAEGLLIGGSFSCIFVERDGQLLTPRDGAGVLREKLIAEGRAVEAELREGDLEGGFLLGNMVLGLLPARLA
jgi:para-aminobenzoate synthetase/4-amino-4-deoxychorismate lyase